MLRFSHPAVLVTCWQSARGSTSSLISPERGVAGLVTSERSASGGHRSGTPRILFGRRHAGTDCLAKVGPPRSSARQIPSHIPHSPRPDSSVCRLKRWLPRMEN